MTSTSDLNPSPQAIALTSAQNKPSPLTSLTASAQRITKRQLSSRTGYGKAEAWQDDSWEMYDLVGEQRFLATTLAGRLAQGRLYVGRLPEDPTDEPEVLEDDEHLAARVFSYFGDTPAQRAQMIARLAVNLFVAGDGWMAGIPTKMMPGYDPADEDDDEEFEDADGIALNDLEWRMLSVTEVTFPSGEVRLQLGAQNDEVVSCSPDDIILIRVWRSHPRRSWEADSPTRSSLPVLRELVGLTMHISAQVDSRLAGAGVFIVPESAKRALAIAAGMDPDSDEDPFTEALMEAMLTPIQNRDSAAALVPLVITVPDESVGLFSHITFSTPLDAEARTLRDESIRRLALGQDAPPELLLGTGGMNHWGAWLVREDVVTTHIEPPLALICDAITTQFLWPVLVEQGMDPDEAKQYVVWYDVSHMVMRPNRLADAQMLHEKKIISDAALRDAANFSETDAPPAVNRSVEMAIAMAQANPALLDNIPEIIAAFDKALGVTDDTVLPDAPTEDVQAESTPQAPSGDGAPEDDASTTEPATDTEPGDALAASGYSLSSLFTPGAYKMVQEFAEARGVSDYEAAKAFLSGDFDAVMHQYGAPGEDFDETVCIMAMPSEGDACQQIGPEEKHATVLYFGKRSEHEDTERIESSKGLMLSVMKVVAEQFDGPFRANVENVESLGDEGAQVWLLDSPDLQRIFDDLQEVDSEMVSLYTGAAATRYPEYKPHVTIGYVDPMADGGDDDQVRDDYVTDDNLDEARQVESIEFAGLSLWWGDERHFIPFGKATSDNSTSTLRVSKGGYKGPAPVRFEADHETATNTGEDTDNEKD